MYSNIAHAEPYIYMNSEANHREEFLKAEATVGITKQNYRQKFIYCAHSNNDNYLLDRCAATPSQLQGFSVEQEKSIGYLMSELIFRSAQSLKLPTSTAIVATSIAHFFYSRVGHLDYDFRDVAMGAVFLACKSQETLRKSYEISAVFDYVLKVFQGQKSPIKIQVLNSTEYEYMRKKVLELQKQILFQLGFEIYRLFDIPHRYIGGFFNKTLQRYPNYKKICQQAWVYLNDFYKTNVCLYYPGQMIAAASIYLALVKLDVKMPTVPWWVLLEANLESMEELIIELQYFYEEMRSSGYTLEKVASFINEVSEKHEFVNVFPVNYYRKIMLDIHRQLKIKKIPAQPQKIESFSQQELQKDRQQNKQRQRNSSASSDARSSSHIKKKKDKKEKRDKKDKKKKKKDKEKNKYRQDEDDLQFKPYRSRSRDQRKSSMSISQRVSSSHPQAESPKAVPLEARQGASPLSKNIPSEQIEDEKKQVVKQLKIESAKGLLSKINSQLSQLKKQQKKPTIHKPQSDSEDERLMAELIKIKKQNIEKKV